MDVEVRIVGGWMLWVGEPRTLRVLLGYSGCVMRLREIATNRADAARPASGIA
jgi:hypothetical protein